jgi:flagellar basal body P-ring formation protein FlgA
MSSHSRTTWREPPPLRGAAVLCLGFFCLLAVPLLLGGAQAGSGAQTDWRVQIREAAVVSGTVVQLGEIAGPVGNMPAETWARLSTTELWPAPERRLKPMRISRAKMQTALATYLGERAQYCILPSSIAIQRGGGLVGQETIIGEIVKTLTPVARNLGGEPEFRDYRTPDFVFLRDPANRLTVELSSAAIQPGRLSLRLREQALDGSVVRSISASVHLDLWKAVPAAARPLNKNEEITPDKVTFVRKNLAYLRSDVWDGRGGPWRMKTTAGKEEVIYRESIEPLPLISRGDVVRLIYKGAHVRLEVPAEAMGDGGFSQTIPVRNMQSSVQVYARVLDADTVQVF